MLGVHGLKVQDPRTPPCWFEWHSVGPVCGRVSRPGGREAPGWTGCKGCETPPRVQGSRPSGHRSSLPCQPGRGGASADQPSRQMPPSRCGGRAASRHLCGLGLPRCKTPSRVQGARPSGLGPPTVAAGRPRHGWVEGGAGRPPGIYCWVGPCGVRDPVPGSRCKTLGIRPTLMVGVARVQGSRPSCRPTGSYLDFTLPLGQSSKHS